MPKEVALSTVERATMACALTCMLNALADFKGEGAKEKKMSTLIIILAIVEKFDLHEFMDEFSPI